MPLLITKKPVHEVQADMIIYIREKEHSDAAVKESFLRRCIRGIRSVTAERRVRSVEYEEETAFSVSAKEYETALTQAVRHGWKHVAVSCEGEIAFALAAEAGKVFSQENDLYITLCLPQQLNYPASMLSSALALIPYLDDSQHRAQTPEPEEEDSFRNFWEDPCESQNLEDTLECPLMDEVIQSPAFENPDEPAYSLQESPKKQVLSPERYPKAKMPQASNSRVQKTESTGGYRAIQEFLKKNDAGFKDTLLKYIDRTGKKDSEIYKKANIDRRLFSKIMNVQGYNPSKSTAIAFAIALELDLEETKDLIGRAGYTLSHASTFDRIIEFFILEGNYDIYEINEALFYFDQSLLGC